MIFYKYIIFPKFSKTGCVVFVVADGKLGYEEGAPYNAIHVGAAAAGQKFLKPLIAITFQFV
jgi:protein-L-isoaspartate O-methyltransferase